MRRLTIILTVVSLLPFTLASAQEPLPWPPDPAAIFAPGVEIVESGLVGRPPDLRPTYDNDARVVRVYQESTGDWREYPYPDEIRSLSGVDAYTTADMLLLSTVRNRGPYGNDPDPTGQWLLDTMTGEFSRPELVCRELRAWEGEGKWIVFYPEAGSLDIELCHTGSGERIPIDVGNDNLDDSISVSVSPDGERAVLFGYRGVYVYTFSTGEIVRLGDVRARDLRTAIWLGNEHVLIEETEMASMTFPWIYYSMGNVRQENSLEIITTAYKPGYISFLDNPRRFEWVEYHDDECYLVQMLVENGQQDEYDLQGLCEQGIPLPGTDERLFSPMRGESRDDTFFPLSRDLVRFNPYTSERHDLYSGEIEFIMDVSADGRYAVVILDDNGQLDMLTNDELQYLGIEIRPRRFRLAIISLETGDILYEVSDAVAPETGDVSGYNGFEFRTFSEDSGRVVNALVPDLYIHPDTALFNIGGERFLLVSLWDFTNTLIELYGSNVTETPLDSVLLVHGERMVTLTDAVRSLAPLNVYNITTHEITTLIPAVNQMYFEGTLYAQGYAVSLNRGSALDTFQVELQNEATQQSWRYVVRIP